MSPKTKKIVWIGILLSVLAGTGYYFTQSQDKKAEKAIEFIAVKRDTLSDVVSATGTLEPKDYVDVGAQISGQIKKLYVDIGDVVKTGDLLAEIDPKTYESVLAGDQAKLDSLKAQLQQQLAQTDYDRLQFQRAQKLIAAKAISQEALEEKEKALKVAEATIKSLEAQIVQAQTTVDKDMINLGYTKIYATMDGVVSNREAREGETLNANQTTPTILQIANLNVMTVKTEIAEADVMRLKESMEATFTTLGSNDRKWTGKIRQILPTPEVVNDVVLYNALIDVPNEDGVLMNGMSAQTSFVVARVENTLVLPVKCLGQRIADKDSERGKVYQVRVQTADGTVAEREVLVGMMTRAKAQILSGLREGEKVMVSSNPGGEPKKGAKNNMTGTPPGMGARL